MRINFHKGTKCFEVKKAINHEFEIHGYGGGEKDEENDDGVCGWLRPWMRKRREDESVVIFVEKVVVINSLIGGGAILSRPLIYLT